MPAPGWGTGAWSCGYDATGNQTSIAESNDEGAVQTSVYDFAGDSRRTGFQPIVRLLQSEPRDRGDQRIDLTTEFLVDHAHE